MSPVRGSVQPSEVCLPLSLARESDLPLGIRLLQLANLSPGEETPPQLIPYHFYWYTHMSVGRVVTLRISAVRGLHEGGEGEAHQGDGGLQEPVPAAAAAAVPSTENSPAGPSGPGRQETPGKNPQSQNVRQWHPHIHIRLLGIPKFRGIL